MEDVWSKKELGSRGEALALATLQQKGYVWLESNFHTRWGEIDLIMKDQSTVVFVEVKYRRNDHCGEPEESITALKRKHLHRAALLYVKKHRLYETNLRFDVVTVDPFGVKHIVNAFYGDGDYYY